MEVLIEIIIAEFDDKKLGVKKGDITTVGWKFIDTKIKKKVLEKLMEDEKWE